MKKKIIIFNASSFIYGAEKGLLNLSKVLRDKFEVTIVLPRSGPIEEKIRSISPDINIRKFPLPVIKFSLSPFYYINFIFLSVLSTIYYIFYVNYKDIDYICSNSLLLVFPSAVSKLTKRKHVWFVREFFSSKLFNSILGRFIRMPSGVVVCQSEAIKNKLLLDEAKVIYEPIDAVDYRMYDYHLARRELNLPINSTIITIVSRLHPLKGQYEFIEKIRSVLKESKDLLLIIAGDTTSYGLRDYLYKRRVERLIRKDNLKNILLLGFRNDIDRILSLSDMCVFPFRREEPFGIAVSEALAFGKVTFFPMKGGLKEVCQIFGKGERLDIKNIVETATSFRDRNNIMPDNIYIPDILSFSTYKNKLKTIFDGKT